MLTMARYSCECHHRWHTQTAWTNFLLQVISVIAACPTFHDYGAQTMMVQDTKDMEVQNSICSDNCLTEQTPDSDSEVSDYLVTVCLIVTIIVIVSIELARNTVSHTIKTVKTRLPGAVPQLIGLFLFCIEFGWG